MENGPTKQARQLLTAIGRSSKVDLPFVPATIKWRLETLDSNHKAQLLMSAGTGNTTSNFKPSQRETERTRKREDEGFGSEL